MAVALIVNFWSFAKKENSTAVPSGNPVRTFSCELKSDSGVLSPILEIGLAMAENPSGWNYAQIPAYSRYYYVSDWQWSEGLWLCSLTSDPLATFRSAIGSEQKYVLRSAYTYNPRLIDDQYPSKFQESEIAQEYNFGFDIENGEYVLGIANRQATHVGGMVSFYRMGESELATLRRAMYPAASDYFEDITLITGDVLRSIVDPWQYIISCKRFPIAIPSDVIQSNILFGQWSSDTDRAIGYRLSALSSWGSLSHDFTIASDWLQRDARERCGPGTRMFVVCNPWGAIELSPSDFSDAAIVRLEILPDFITGDAILKIYSVKGPLATLIAQRTAKIGVDTTIASTRISAIGAISGAVSAVGNAFAGNLGGALYGVKSAGESMVPSLAGSTALQEGLRSLEGVARLIVRTPSFPSQAVSELGRPLCDTRTLSTLPGYLKLADGDFKAAGAYKEDLDAIGTYFTSGFYYE